MTKEEFRANLYTALVATTQNPVVIQEQIKIAEEFVFLGVSVSSERLDTMAQAIKVVCDNTLVGIMTRKERQDLLQTILQDPMRHQLRAYKDHLLAVHCRIGSLEIRVMLGKRKSKVHCRIGRIEYI